MLISGPQFGLVTRLSCMCVKGRVVARGGVRGDGVTGSVFEDRPGEVRRPWNGTPC